MALARLAQMTGTSLHWSPFIQKVSLAVHGGHRGSKEHLLRPRLMSPTITSVTFLWPKQVKRPIQIIRVEKLTHISREKVQKFVPILVLYHTHGADSLLGARMWRLFGAYPCFWDIHSARETNLQLVLLVVQWPGLSLVVRWSGKGVIGTGGKLQLKITVLG